MSDTFDTFKDAMKNPKDNLLAFEGGVPNFVGLYKQGKINKGKKDEAEKNAQLDQQKVQAESQRKYDEQQAAANSAAQEKLLAMRLRKQNRSGTLLTTPGSSGAETLG